MPFYKNKKVILGITAFVIILLIVFTAIVVLMSRPAPTTTLPPVSEPVSNPIIVSLPVDQHMQSYLALLHPENFAFTIVNASQYCTGPLDGFESYRNSDNEEFLIHRRSMNITDEATLQFNNAVSIIKGEELFSDLDTRNPLDAFRDFCSGFVSFYTNGYKLNYPNAEAAILIPSIDTQSVINGVPTDLTIRVLGLKGGDIFQVTFRLNGNNYFTQAEAESCNKMSEYDYSYTDQGCVIKKLDTNIPKQKLLIQDAEKVISTKFQLAE